MTVRIARTAEKPISEGTTDAVAQAIYLDCHATTPVDQRVATVVFNIMTSVVGNANSATHTFGEAAAQVVEIAQRHVANLVGADLEGVIFTSGATHAIRVAVADLRKRVVAARGRLGLRGQPLRIVSSPIEHHAVLDLITELEQEGQAQVVWMHVDHKGRINLNEVRHQCLRGVDLVCLMAANNEIGNLYPIREVAEIAVAAGAALLVDATQAVGRVSVELNNWGITYLTLSAHKMYGPPGVGALVMDTSFGRLKTGAALGTPNVPGIAGLGEAARLRRIEMEADERRIARLRDILEVTLCNSITHLKVNGDRANRLAGNLHISVPGVPNDAILARLRHRVAISSGSACTSGAHAPSHVLRALGLTEALLEGALRIGVGKFNTEEEIERGGWIISEAVREVRRAVLRK